VHNRIPVEETFAKRILVQSFRAPTWLPYGSINSPGRASRTHGIPPDIAAELADHATDNALTDREIGVLKLIAAGNSNKLIADHYRAARQR
jgi:ATP/maltotriose-dependent transcriptional regulator MalT